MSWEVIFEVIAGIVGLGVLVYIVFAPVKIGKPYLDGTEVLGPEPKDGDRH